jgi:hypothetical protein
MPTVLSSSLRHKNLNNFKNTVEDESVYFFVSKPSGWTNDLIPDSVFDTFTLESDAFDEMIYLKKLSISNCVNVIRLHRWQENRRYQEYDNQSDLSDLLTKRTISTNEYYPFYVITDTYKVYKCISNGGNALSTVEPTTTAFTGGDLYQPLSDGYIWKYMYTLKPLDASEFLTTDWFPIRTIAEDDSTDNWDIITNSVSGGVYNVKVTSSGSGYNRLLPSTGDTTDAQDGVTFTKTSNTQITITSGSPSATSSFYNGSFFYTKNISGVITEVAEITAYDGAGGVTLASPGITNAAAGYEGYISPKITFSGDGTGLSAVCRVVSNAINKIQIVNPGSGYTECTATISAPAGSGATARVIISPNGGHGSDPVVELGGFNLLSKVKFEGDEGGAIVSSNEYRKIGIIVNPLVQGSIKQAQARSGMSTSQIKLNTADTSSNVTAGKKIIIYSGNGKGQLRTISTFDNSTKIATVTEAFDILPDATSYYGFLATDSVINQCLVISYNTIGSTITPDSVIYEGSVSAETAIGNVVQHDTVNKKVYVTNLGKTTGAATFPYFTGSTGVQVTGGPSFTPTGATGPLIAKNTGSVIYMENRTPLSRYTEQIEDIRVIIQF